MFDFFKKHDRQATIITSGESFTVKAGEKLLNAALQAGIDWPHDCRVGSCGRCRCTLTAGKIKALSDFSYTLTHDQLSAGMILACQSQLRSDIAIEVQTGSKATKTESVSGHISKVTTLTHDILEVTVELKSRAFASARAGQYLEILNDKLRLPRSYSLAKRPAEGGSTSVSFVIRHVPGGEFTDWLFGENRCTSTLSLTGPFGDFYLRAPKQRMICIAGGSGLAPIVALIEQGVAEARAENCTVLFGARTQADLYYLDLIRDLGERWHGDFVLTPILSNEPANSDWSGQRGLVTTAIANLAKQSDFANDQAYLCGPPAMIDAAIDELARYNMKEEAIYFDKFLDASDMPSGRG